MARLAKTVYSPVKYGTNPGTYYLIDCCPSGFQTLKFIFVDNVTTPTWRTVCLTNTKQSLQHAVDALYKSISPLGDGEVGELPPSSTSYGEARIISAAEANELEVQRAAAVAVSGVIDPRKEKKAQREQEKRTREQREIAGGFLVAFNDTTAAWTESRRGAYRLVKGSALSLDPLDLKHHHLNSDEREKKAKALAYELGGTFTLTGFFDEHEAFVITSQTTNDEALERRIARARPGHLRRARLYQTLDERADAIKAIIDGTADATIHVTCHHRNAIRYADTIIDRETLDIIMPLLNSDERELFDARIHATV